MVEIKGGTVSRVAADGKLYVCNDGLRAAPLTTNICFGGRDLSTAYITLSGTGKLASMKWPRPGLMPNLG